VIDESTLELGWTDLVENLKLNGRVEGLEPGQIV
jgi:hypothetical protein